MIIYWSVSQLNFRTNKHEINLIRAVICFSILVVSIFTNLNNNEILTHVNSNEEQHTEPINQSEFLTTSKMSPPQKPLRLSNLVEDLLSVTPETADDTDGDGLPDSVEWVIGTNSTNNDFLRLTSSPHKIHLYVLGGI